MKMTWAQVGRAKTATDAALQDSALQGSRGHGSKTASGKRAAISHGQRKGGVSGGPDRDREPLQALQGPTAAESGLLDPWPLPRPPSLQGPVGVLVLVCVRRQVLFRNAS